MFITSLRVEGIGRFGTAASVDGFGPGVNVLAAGNEVGKSTLFKAIRTCLFSRHDSKTQDIRDLGSDDSQLPATIELTFQRDGKVYVIKKSFLRSPSATLTEDGREIARFKQADEAIWDILGISPGSGRSLDEGAFGVLWVGQGASFAAPVPGAGASSMLSAAIESEVGALVGGERARGTIDGINAELKRYLTDSERAARSDGPLSRAQQSLEQWRTSESEASGKFAALEQQLAELIQKRRRHRDLTDPAARDQMTQGLVEARNSLTEAQSSAQEIRRLEAESLSAKGALENAAQRLRRHRELIQRIDGNRSLEADLTNALPAQMERENEARAARARTLEHLTASEKDTEALALKEQQLERLASATVRAMRKDDLTLQLTTLEAAAANLIEIDAQLSQSRIKPKAVEELDDLERQIASLDAQLSAAAAHLSIEVKPAGSGKVRVGTLRPEGNHAAPVLMPTTISVGDLAVVTVTPASHPRLEKRQTLDAERVLLLKSAGAASVAEAHALLAKRRELEANRKGILAELKSLKVTDEPGAVIAKVKAALAETEAAIAAALATTGRTSLPSQKDTDEERIQLRQQRAEIEARRANLDEARGQQQRALEESLTQRSGTESKLEVVRNTIAEDVVLCPDDDRSPRSTALVAEVAACETTHQTASTTLAALRQMAPDAAEIERRETRCARLEQALENHKTELMQLERDLGRLTGQIQTAGGDGVSEVLAAAQEQRALAERECGRLEERIATLQLLRDTVSSCLSEGRERYYEPVRRHLRPFLNDLFPGAELELGDGFTITGMTRKRSENFKRLSGGTQEQIAVLVRLAMGAMLAERGGIVPIILDDALVYCDDDRINLMFDALSRAGKHQQIIVLTCRLRSFASLGGHTLRVRLDSEDH